MALQQYGALTEIFREKSRWGAAYMWVAPPLNSSGLVTLAYDGNDPDFVIPVGIPRPASGGVFLGFDEDGVVEKPNVSYEKIPVFGSTVPRSVRVKEEDSTVTARLVFNNDALIRSFFVPTGLWYQSGFSYGGLTTVNLWPLLIILTNEEKPEQIECHYYYAGYFDPTPTTSGRLFAPIEMVYHCVAGTTTIDGGAHTCLLPAGQRIMKAWFVIIDGLGNNILVDILGNTIIPDTTPQLTYLETRWLGVL